MYGRTIQLTSGTDFDTYTIIYDSQLSFIITFLAGTDMASVLNTINAMAPA